MAPRQLGGMRPMPSGGKSARRSIGGAVVKPRPGEALAALLLLLMFVVTYLTYPHLQDNGPAVVVRQELVLGGASREPLEVSEEDEEDEEDEDNKDETPVRAGTNEEEDRGAYPNQNDEDRLDAASDVALEGGEDDLREHKEQMNVKSIEAMEDFRSGKTKVQVGPFSTVVPELGGLLFTDGAEYMAAEDVQIPAPELGPRDYRSLWYLQKMHDDFFAEHTHKRFIPHLDEPISRKQFHEVFRQTSTPVVLKFEHMRNLGLLTKGWTIKEMRERFPYEPKPGAKKLNYHARAGLAGQQLDLGPALYELERNAKLARGAKGSTLRNFPRNLMIKPKYLSLLDVSFPPFLPKNRFQVPTLWMGTTTADTKLHHDCCDNFVMMLAGTKRWFIAPPPDSRQLRPVVCTGKHQSLCWASLKYPNKADLNQRDAAMRDSLQYIVLDLKPGEMLYLPAGWWHHIENLEPTVMVNFWTRGCSNSEVALDKDPNRADRPDFSGCPQVAQKTNDFLNMM